MGASSAKSQMEMGGGVGWGGEREMEQAVASGGVSRACSSEGGCWARGTV